MQTFPTATVDALLLTERAEDFYSVPRSIMEFDLDGIVDDQRHRGRAMPADIRIKSYSKGGEVLNRQTVSLIDKDSLEHIADEIEIDGQVIREAFGKERSVFLAQCLGINIVFRDYEGTKDIPAFHKIPNATDVGPFDSNTGKFSSASVMITRYNLPCMTAGRKLEEHYPESADGLATRFVKAALACRGLVGMVVKPGTMSVGDAVMFRPLPTANDYAPSQ